MGGRDLAFASGGAEALMMAVASEQSCQRALMTYRVSMIRCTAWLCVASILSLACRRASGGMGMLISSYRDWTVFAKKGLWFSLSVLLFVRIRFDRSGGGPCEVST